ncbi:hypothetical protein D1007_16066 [Hordeum vulgare]|nr:hypothetical protein D1007_16066 [Hordeum vulgare]
MGTEVVHGQEVIADVMLSKDWRNMMRPVIWTRVCLLLMMAASAKVQGRTVAGVPACCSYRPECCERLTAEAPLAAAVIP